MMTRASLQMPITGLALHAVLTLLSLHAHSSPVQWDYYPHFTDQGTLALKELRTQHTDTGTQTQGGPIPSLYCTSSPASPASPASLASPLLSLPALAFHLSVPQGGSQSSSPSTAREPPLVDSAQATGGLGGVLLPAGIARSTHATHI